MHSEIYDFYVNLLFILDFAEYVEFFVVTFIQWLQLSNDLTPKYMIFSEIKLFLMVEFATRIENSSSVLAVIQVLQHSKDLLH